MTKLTKTVQRISAGFVHQASKVRPIVVSLEPPSVLGFRAKGCRKTYKLTAKACYWLAVKAEQRYNARQKQNLKRKRKKKHNGEKNSKKHLL